jgi:hypothetical protein
MHLLITLICITSESMLGIQIAEEDGNKASTIVGGLIRQHLCFFSFSTWHLHWPLIFELPSQHKSHLFIQHCKHGCWILLPARRVAWFSIGRSTKFGKLTFYW